MVVPLGGGQATAQPNTYSWLLVPLFGHALGKGALIPEFPAHQEPFATWLPVIAAALADAQPPYNTWAGVVAGGNPLYIPAHTQTHMLHTILQQHAHGHDFDVSLAIDM